MTGAIPSATYSKVMRRECRCKEKKEKKSTSWQRKEKIWSTSVFFFFVPFSKWSHYTTHTAPSSARVHTWDGAYTNSVVLKSNSGLFSWEAKDIFSLSRSIYGSVHMYILVSQDLSHPRLKVKKIATMWASQFPQKMERIYSLSSWETLEMIKDEHLKANWIRTVQQIRLSGRTGVLTMDAQRPHTHTHTHTLYARWHTPCCKWVSHAKCISIKRKINVNPSTAFSSPFLLLSPVTFY